jgi:hypothetical protein
MWFALRATRSSCLGLFRATRWLAKLLVRFVGSCVLFGRDTLQCPGCQGDVPLYGFFFCEWCQAKFLGHAFAPCPTPGCGAVPGWIPCPRCEHSVYNPMSFGS